VRVGVQLPEVERIVSWREYLSLARAAEDVGFDSIWLGDHLLYRGDGRPERGPWDVWTMLAALAASTTRVSLGPLVASTAFHPPGLIARMAAAVQEISGGRFVLGLGSGWNEMEFRAFGLPFDRRAARFVEAFEIVRHLLVGERLTFGGEFFSLDDAVLLPRPSRPPRLMVGTTGPRLLEATLPHVDAWNTWYEWYGNTAAGFAAGNAEISAAVERAGRDPAEVERSACALVVLDPASTERRLDPETPPLCGSSAEIAAGLHALGAAGADEIVVVASPIDERSLERLGEVLALLGGG
jgi:alkanesulfonate monooxygenase SsuD/methylene tetrahydromethanopterin reductase-like flavin-dependent oxidoreductase (luciferase family)